MADSPLSKDDLKLWLRIDGSDEDSLLDLLLDAATKKIEKAVTNDSVLYDSLHIDSRFKIAVSMVVSDIHENPLGFTTSVPVEIPDGVIGFIHDLRCDYPCLPETDVTT